MCLNHFLSVFPEVYTSAHWYCMMVEQKDNVNGQYNRTKGVNRLSIEHGE